MGKIHIWGTAALDFADGLYQKIAGVRRAEHPFDRALGIETSQRVNPRFVKTGDAALDVAAVTYVGATPSVLRKCLEIIGVEDDTTFVDLGCGKGRPLFVAAEYPFRSLVGIELSEYICKLARDNVARLPKRLRGERISIVHGDASTPALPSGTVVVFLYNPFRNPRFSRYFADRIDFTEEEAAASPCGNTFDSVVIYQSANEGQRPALPGADRKIRITIPDMGADVQPN
jgi:SAM-dependent methyltransferase